MLNTVIFVVGLVLVGVLYVVGAILALVPLAVIFLGYWLYELLDWLDVRASIRALDRRYRK